MAEQERRQFALNELLPVFAAQEHLGHPCVLMGGQSVCHWALRYLPSEPVLQAMERETALLSKDVDFQGSRQATIAFAKALGHRAEVPSFRRAFGNLMAGKFSVLVAGERLNVEVLRKVPGLTRNQLEKLATFDRLGGVTIRILNPLGVVMAKSWNVVNISKEGRRDAEQLLVAFACVRAFFRTLLTHAQTDRSAVRPTLNLIELALRFTELPTGRKIAERCGLDWSQILPHNFIAASTQPELVRLRGFRIPLWLARISTHKRAIPEGKTLFRLLEILARHAEPLCAQPVTNNRKSQIGNRKSK